MKRKPTFAPLPQGRQSVAYRGYLIQPASIAGDDWIVTKDGFCICHPNTIEDAKRQIEEFTQ